MLIIMSKFFVPYLGDAPAAVEVNGHRLLFVYNSEDELTAELAKIGADQIKEVALLDHDDDDIVLSSLASQIEGGVVVAPIGISVSAMIKSLEHELPWIH